MSTKTFDFNGKPFKYSYNSFQYMDEIDFSILEGKTLLKKPLKIATMLQYLVMGAVNYHPKIKVGEEEVIDYIDNFLVEGGDINELLTFLIEMLQETNFFKSLQQTK